MAASSATMLLRRAVGFLAFRGVVRTPFWVQNVPSVSLLQPERLPVRIFSTESSLAGSTEAVALDTESQFKEKPWEYLESEEYIEKYGSNPVWFGYRRNHKGQIPPQKTRKTCIDACVLWSDASYGAKNMRGKNICGNPCPICRDQNLFLDYRNVKLLEQFICPYTGITYHPTRTGVCMKKYKQLTQAIQQARDNGLLPIHVPFANYQNEDCSNQHPAVTKTPPSPAVQSKVAWYEWYDWQQPPEKEIKRIRRIYKNYLKEETGPP